MDYNMNKRKTASLRTDNTFGVIETVKGRGDVFVEFLPSIWLRPNKKNGQIKVRESAKCYYPRHMHDQTREEYLMFLRNAKFECLQPAKNKKWDLLDCRVLKVDIGSFDEAVNAEKLFSEYFNTTDAEAEMKPSQPQRSKKTKKATAKALYESESEDESPGALRAVQTKEISCYDTAFKKPAIHHNSNDVDAINKTSSVVDSNEPFLSKENLLSSCLSLGALGIRNISPIVDPEPIGIVGTGIITEETQQNIAEDLETPVIFEFIDQRQGITSCKGACNCCGQKFLNKMDYFQKKMLSEVGRYRQETMQAIRHFADRYDVLLKSPEFQSIVPEEDQVKQALDEEFETQFTNDFPAMTSLAIIETDKKIKSDRGFRKRFIAKLKRKEKDANETKAVRQFLKILCAASCLSEFTWLGTQTKESFSALESLIYVIALIVEGQFPKCDAYKIIKEVVKQRTKSAAEYMASLKKLEQQAASVVKERQCTGTANDQRNDDDTNEVESLESGN